MRTEKEILELFLKYKRVWLDEWLPPLSTINDIVNILLAYDIITEDERVLIKNYIKKNVDDELFNDPSPASTLKWINQQIEKL